jgi:hypothetical protein
MSKKLVEQENAKTADESIKPQPGSIWKIHVKRG